MNKFEESVISLLMVVMTLLVFVEVIMRFCFNAGFLWIQELTLQISAWMVLLGASYGLKVGSHIGVDALVRTFSPNARRAVTSAAVICGLVYCGLFLYGSWVYTDKMWVTGIELEDMAIPRWLAHGAMLLLGFSLIAWRLLVLLYKLITGQASGFGLMDETKDSLKLAEEAKRISEQQGGESK